MQGASGGREEEGSKKSIPNIHICLAVLIRGAQNHTQVPKIIVSITFCESMQSRYNHQSRNTSNYCRVAVRRAVEHGCYRCLLAETDRSSCLSSLVRVE